MKHWYTLYTKPKAEHQVAALLRQQGIRTYLPEINPDTESGPVALFPCYLFIHVDLQQVALSRLQWTPGVRYVVGFDEKPTRVDERLITFIQQRLGQPTQAHFEPGETVRITSGPFESLLAVFEGPATSAERVEVLLEILGHAARVQLKTDMLEKVSPSEPTEPKPKRPRRTRGRGRRIKNRQGHATVA